MESDDVQKRKNFLLDATRITTGQFTGGFLIVKLWKIIALTSKNSKIVKKKRKFVKIIFAGLEKAQKKEEKFSFLFTHEKIILLSVSNDKSLNFQFC